MLYLSLDNCAKKITQEMFFSCHFHSQKLLAKQISNAFNFLLGSISAIRVRKSKSDGEQGAVIEL